MPADSERRCRRCSTYLNENGTCINRHCPSNNETVPAPARAEPTTDDYPGAYGFIADCVPMCGLPLEAFRQPANHAADQHPQADDLPPVLFAYTDEDDLTPLESPQAKSRYPERTRSGTRARVDPNATDTDDEEPNSSTG
ncbi:MAG TPA: hypothetical protein VN397_04335 [Candidatus Methylomirabilis sp.]|nr:hypothetical protein [Candidatus Methylomirabilis sp.]